MLQEGFGAKGAEGLGDAALTGGASLGHISTLLSIAEASAGLTSRCGFGWHEKLVSKLERVQKQAVGETA